MFQTFVFVIVFAEGQAILWPKRNDTNTTYKNYQLWQAAIKNINLTTDFEERIAEKDIWHRNDNNIDFLLNGNEIEYWNKFLQSQNISYEVLLKDVQEAIEKSGLIKKGGWRRAGKIDWSSYPKLSDVQAYLKSVAASNSRYCSYKSIGQSANKKDIMMLKISNGNETNRQLLIEAAMHGREWVGVVTLLYFIEHIAWNFTDQPEYIRNKDWHIIPVLNPDGYEYSMTKDRLWRKNRRRFSGPCDGVDLNRNFDYKWAQRGASFDICSHYYCGPYTFSEQETIAIRNLIRSQHFTAYVGIHSYGSSVVIPWIFDGRPTFDKDVHIYVAKEMVMAMRKVANEHFTAGTVGILHMKKGSGTAQDWAYSSGVHFSFGIETRGTNVDQFVLEPHQLVPASREVVAGIVRMAEVIPSAQS